MTKKSIEPKLEDLRYMNKVVKKTKMKKNKMKFKKIRDRDKLEIMV